MQLSKEKGHLDTYCSSLWTCPRLYTQQIVALGLSSAQQWPWGAERGPFLFTVTLPLILGLLSGTEAHTALMAFVYCNMLHLTCLTCLCVYKNNSKTNESDCIVDGNRSCCSDNLIYTLMHLKTGDESENNVAVLKIRLTSHAGLDCNTLWLM